MIADIVLQVAITSLTTSVLIATLLMLVPLLQKRYPAKWRYIAWMVIAVRLLVPLSISILEAPIQIIIPEQAPATPIATVETSIQGMEAIPQTDQTAEPDEIAASDNLQFSEAPTTPGAHPTGIEYSPMKVAGFIWLFGAIMFLLLQLVAYQLFLLKLRKSTTREVPQYIKETVWQIGVDMGVCKLPESTITEAVEAPVLTGIVRLRLLLPHENYTEDELRFILRHELVHYRRRDMWYKLLLMLANAMHWFNPLVYLMVSQAGKDVELSCDDDVTRELDKDGRARYGDTILAALPQKSRMEPMFSTHFGSTKKNMKGRLHNLFDMTLKRRGFAALCAVAICAITVTGAVTVGYAAAKSETSLIIVGEQSLSIPYTFSVESIEPGEVVCIGKVELGPDISYTANLLIGSGGGSMMALHESPDITQHDGIEWSHYFSGGSQIYFSSEKSASRYVYVGCKPDGIRLTNVSGKLIPHESGSNYAFSGTSPLIQTSIFARASDGTWASATEIEGNSYQAQLDGKLRWLDAVYAEHKTPFIISETIPENESYHTAGIGYLYNTSEVYRTMSQMKNGSFHLTDGSSFSRSGLLSGKLYDRTAVMVDSVADLTIDMKYDLMEGKMALWLINPSGKQVYTSDLLKANNGSYTVQGEKGLWSVITVSEAEKGAISGTSQIALKTAESTTQLKAVPSSNFAVQRLGQVTFKSGDTLQADLSWNGGGHVMLLYTDKDYTDNEILVPLQGLPEIPKPDYSSVDQSKIGSVFNFSQSPNSPIIWENRDTKPGTYYFYIVQYGFDTFNRVNGSIAIQRTNGYSNVFWRQDGVNNSGKTVSIPQSGENAVFQLNNNGQKSITKSGSFEAKAGQKLSVLYECGIKGGTVDLFLFSPSGSEQRITFGGTTGLSGDGGITTSLSAGTWAYNCTGFFKSGNIAITGTLNDSTSVGAQISQSSKSDTDSYDEEGIRIMENSGTWGESINRLLPKMSPAGVEKVVDIYLERHLFPGITTSQGARQVAATIEPALKYMTKKAVESANSRISTYYNN